MKLCTVHTNTYTQTALIFLPHSLISLHLSSLRWLYGVLFCVQYGVAKMETWGLCSLFIKKKFQTIRCFSVFLCFIFILRFLYAWIPSVTCYSIPNSITAFRLNGNLSSEFYIYIQIRCVIFCSIKYAHT